MKKISLILTLVWLGFIAKSQTVSGPCTGSTSIGGKVFKDMNYDGTADGTAGWDSVIVTLYNNAGLVGSVYTNASGQYTFAGVTTPNKWRVEFTVGANRAYLSNSSPATASSVQFVSAPSCAVNVVYGNPSLYCQTNPPLTTSVFAKGGNTVPVHGVVKWSANNEGIAVQDLTRIANGTSVGSVWGKAYSRSLKKLYVSAVLKCHTELGSNGLDAIYMVDPFSGIANSTPWIDLTDDLGIAVSSITAPPQYLTNAARGVTASPQHDATAFSDAGKVGLGDIELSADESILYVVNLFDKKIYAISTVTKTLVATYTIPNPGCTNGQYRPFALGEQDGKIYVGVICDGSSSGNPAVLSNNSGVGNLKATVYRLDGAAFTQVLTFPLNYEREVPFQYSVGCDSVKFWKPWINVLPAFCADTNVAYPTPLLTDIEFADNGDMILGFTDRTGLQIGNENYGPVTTSTQLYSMYAAGEILKACKSGTAFAIESTTGSRQSAGGLAIGTPDPNGYFPSWGILPKAGEFYEGDYWHQDGNLDGTNVSFYPAHGETTSGGLAVVPNTNEVISTAYDPVVGQPFVVRGGVITLSNTNGQKPQNGFQIYNSSSDVGGDNEVTFGKGVGLGDLEVLCDAAPIKTGNYAWFDADSDGIQDPSELPVSGLIVGLYDTTGVLIASSTTTSAGIYSFAQPNISAYTKYYLVFGNTQISAGKIMLSSVPYVATSANIGQGTNSDLNDSDPTAGALFNGAPYMLMTTARSGSNFSNDIGLVAPPPCVVPSAITIAQTSATCTGAVFNNNGKITLTAVSSADKYGVSVGATYSGTPDYATASTITLPQDVQIAIPNSGGTYTLRLFNGSNTCFKDTTIIVAPVTCACGSVGNYVWNDLNGNGTNDEAATAGINGVIVELWNATTNTLVSSTTTANDVTSNPGYYNFQVCTSGDYYVKFPIANAGFNLTSQTATAATDNNSDANPTTGVSPTFTMDPNGTGVAKDNMTIDAAYHACGSVGNYVWNDLNGNGTNDEATTAGINGVIVELWNATTNTLVSSTTTANDVTSNPGYYNFQVCTSGDYYVKFPIANAGVNLTSQTATAATDNNSDANPTTGVSPTFTMDPNGTGVAKDNMTIDAAYHACGSVGNYVWNDLNGNGTNDEATNAGINGVIVELWNATTNTLVSSTTTANDVTSNPGYYNFQVCTASDYYVKFPIANAGVNLTSQTATAATDNNSDANPTTGVSPTFTMDPNGTGVAKDNMTIDAAYHACGSVGNYVWNDLNGNVTNDEAATAGINGVIVELWNATTNTLVTSDTTANDGTGNPGYYLFTVCTSGDYYVKFPTTNGGNDLTTQTTTAATDNNSDASTVDGNSPTFTLNVNGSGTDKDNMTIDAAYHACGSVGNYVWSDLNNNGLNDEASTAGINSVIVELWNATTNTLVASDTTANDGTGNPGYYNFEVCTSGDYKVKFPTTNGANNLTTQTTTTATDNNSDANTVDGFSPTFTLNVNGSGTDKDNMTIDAAYQTCIQPSAGTDMTACGGTCMDITGTSPTTGTWTADASNQVGATLSTTTAGVANVCFTNTASGSYNFIYSIGATCSDTMTIVVTPKPDAGPNMTACYNNGNGTVTMGATGTGNWSEQSGNPGTSTITASSNPTTTITNFSAMGTYNYIWTTGSCTDTVSVIISPSGSIGNYVWNDLNTNGTNDEAATAGINGVTVELWNATTNTLVASQTTANDGTGNPGYYNFTICESASYKVKFPLVAGALILTSQTAMPSTDNNSDASLVDGFSPVFAIDLNGSGTALNNNTIDAGFTPIGSIGNYVWIDSNLNGLNDEPTSYGINGVKVILCKAGTDGLLGTSDDVVADSTWTVTNAGNPGYYIFDSLFSGNYGVKFPLTDANRNLTTTTATAQTDNNSDANQTTGASALVVINAAGTGNDKDNMTIDAGYKPTGSIGNYVWNDADGNGLQNEPTANGINNVPVKLCTAGLDGIVGNGDDVLVDSTLTGLDGSGNSGYYIFDFLPSGNYFVKFPLTFGDAVLTPIVNTTAQTDGNSDANTTTGFSPLVPINVLGTGADKDNMTIDAGLVPFGSIGDYVWKDVNENGLQDEPTTDGINGEKVYLCSPGIDGIVGNTDDVLLDSTVTANHPTSGNSGYYLFPNLKSGNYFVHFDVANEVGTITLQTATSQTNGNSDGDATTGNSPLVVINAYSPGQDKDNTTIDAGYKPYNALGNFVWLDDDKDGSQNTGEPGVASISVTLFGNGTDGLPCTTDDVILGSTTTDAYGYYLFTKLPSGNYNVGFALPANYEYTSTTGSSDTNPLNSDADVAKGRTGTINLSGGETELDVDAGIIFSTPPALSSLGDYVWYDTNGDGIQDANEPAIAGVTVTLCDAVTGNVIALTTTDAAGKYIFNDLANGNYKVGFTPKPGTVFTQSNGGTTPGNATTNSDVDPLTGKTATVSITAAGTVIEGIDAGFKDDAKASLGDLVWNDLNHDGLQTAGEPGVSGVTMTLYSPGADSVIGGADDVMIASTKTDANGIYWFPNLDPGLYFVTCSPVAGYVLTGQDAGTDDLKDNDFGTNAAYLGVGVTSQVYNLLAGQNYPGVDKGIYNSTPNLGSIGDKVWFDADGDGVQDPSETGVSGVTICLLDDVGTPVNNPTTGKPYVVQTDANGNYLFTDLPADDYKVGFKNIPAGTSLSPTGSGTAGTDSDPNPLTGITPTFALAPGQNITDVDAGIVPGVPAGKGSLGNFVWIDANNDGMQDAGEQGVANVQVDLCEDSNGDGVINGAEATTPVASTHTDAQGYYIFTGLDANTYQVKFVTSTFPAGYALQAGKDNQGTNDAKDSDPNPTTGVTGLYILAQGEDNMTVDAGLYNTTATNSVGDYVWLDKDADGIQDAGEVGVPGVPVNLLNAAGQVISTTVTDANGNYHFGNLPNGTYCVKVVAPVGFNITSQNTGANDAIDSDIDPSTGKTAAVTLTGNTNITDLDAGLTTTRAALGDYVWLDANKDGIQDANESPVSGVTACLLRPGFGLDGIAGNGDDALPVASAITDANGFYFFSNLEGGIYDVLFKTIPSGLEFTMQNVTTPNDATDSDVDPAVSKITGIVLDAGQVDPTNDAGLIPIQLGSVGDCVWFDANVDGVRDANETPVPGVIVTLKDNNGIVIGTGITEGNGKFLFENIPAGTGFTLTFSNLPTGASLTTQGVGATATNSDANATTGITTPFNIVGGAKTPNIDAGITVYLPLPVVIKEFNVTKINCNVTVHWTTSSEQNVSHFNVMRKESKEPNFKQVAKLQAAGNSNTEQHYTYKETNITKGNYAYYLETVDIDTKLYTSDLRSLSLNCESSSVSVYPNPVLENINVKIVSEDVGEYLIKVSDFTGRTLVVTSTTVEQGMKVVVIPTATFAAGLYHVEVRSESNVETFKIEKVK